MHELLIDLSYLCCSSLTPSRGDSREQQPAERCRQTVGDGSRFTADLHKPVLLLYPLLLSD